MLKRKELTESKEYIDKKEDHLKEIEPEMFFEMTIQIYENLYNQEIAKRKDLDEKIVSRISILTIQFTLVGILGEWFLGKLQGINWGNCFWGVEQFVFLMGVFLVILQVVFFYKSFFRVRKNYKEIALEEIRMFHLHCANNKTKYNRQHRYKIVSDEEVELLMYLRDSYQYCAYHNMQTNLKRGSALIKFDNITILNMLILLADYFILYAKGGLPWFQ